MSDTLKAWVDWLSSQNSSNLENQRDDEAPTIDYSWSFYVWSPSGTDIQLEVTETSYREAWTLSEYSWTVAGDGLAVIFSWTGLCYQLNTSQIRGEATRVDIDGTYSVTISGWPWVYQWCTMTVYDHGNNASNTITLDPFVLSDESNAICLHPYLDVDQAECETLMTWYDDLWWEDWVNSTARWQTPYISDWYGVTVSQWHVIALTLKNNSLTWRLWNDMGWLPFVISINVSNSSNTATPNQITTLDEAVFNETSTLATLYLDRNLVASLPVISPVGWTSSSLQLLSLNRNPLTTLDASIGNLVWLDILYLTETQLTSLPSTIGTLTELDALYLSLNPSLTVLPAEFGNLPSLEVLEINDNWLIALPSQINQISTLRVLSADGNEITAIPDLTGLDALETLSLDDNLIDGQLQWLDQLTTLTTLSIVNNSIDSLDGIWLLTSLEYIYAKNNQITTLGTDISGLTNLQLISIYNETNSANQNALTVLPDMSALTSLTTLYANNNQITAIPEWLRSLDNLRFVTLNDNKITGRLDDSLINPDTSLITLYLHDNALDRQASHWAIVPDGFSSWTSTHSVLFNISNQSDTTAPILTGTGTTWYLNFNLDWDIEWNENSYAVTLDSEELDFVFSGVANCEYLNVLQTLDLSSWTGTIQINSIIDSDELIFEDCSMALVDHAGNTSQYIFIGEEFSFSNDYTLFCSFAELPIPVDECIALALLYSGTNGSSLEIGLWWYSNDNWFGTMDIGSWYGITTTTIDAQLHVVGVDMTTDGSLDSSGNPAPWNNLVGSLDESLGNLTKLRVLALDDNYLLSDIPQRLAEIDTLQWLSLRWVESNTSFGLEGSLWTDWSALSNLEVFDISFNNISWTLPAGVTSAAALKILAIAGNDLSWSLPSDWIGLTDLQVLDLANNELEGNIPSGLIDLWSLTQLRLEANELVGTIPVSFIWYGTRLDAFTVQQNNFDRESDATPDLSDISSVESWYASLPLTKRYGQQWDITTPVLTDPGSTTIPFTVWSGWFDYVLSIDENSYALETTTAWTLWMRIEFDPVGVCASLQSTTIDQNNGTVTITILPSASGIYDGCRLRVVDHSDGNGKGTQTIAWNTSNRITLWSFAYDIGDVSICLDPALTITKDECLALVDIYENTDGESRSNSYQWFESGDPADWYGVVTAPWASWEKDHVTALYFQKDDTTSATIGDQSGNGLSGSLGSSIADLAWLEHLDISNNSISSLPSEITSLASLQTLKASNSGIAWFLPTGLWASQSLASIDLSNNTLEWWFPADVITSDLISIDMSQNQFSGELPDDWSDTTWLESIKLSVNWFSGVLPQSLFDIMVLEQIDLWGNSFNGVLPSLLFATDIETIDLSNNNIYDTISSTWWNRSNLTSLDLSHNSLYGNALSIFLNSPVLGSLDLSHNTITGRIPEEWDENGALDTLNLENNALDRNVDHSAILDADLGGRAASLTAYNGADQDDITRPILTTDTRLYSPISAEFTIDLAIYENSYTSDGGQGMEITLVWDGCDSLYLLPTQTTVSDDIQTVTIWAYQPGVYACQLWVTDFGDNTGLLTIPIFIYDTSCGDEIIDSNGPDGIPGNADDEVCDEWRFCDDDATITCTNDSTICQSATALTNGSDGICRPRLIDNCTPACTASICGDRFIDEYGIDNDAWTYDDEYCDEWRYCYDGTDCTYDVSICPGGLLECRPKLVNSCTPFCGLASGCGDGTLDPDGADNTEATDDDESCDDGNTLNGDGCSDQCEIEVCGDGYTDTDGPDNNINTIDDNEQCDVWQWNGVLWGACSSTCKLARDECVFCFETCDGWDEDHSIFLLIDVSWSMAYYDRIENAIGGSKGFVDLIEDAASANPLFSTKVWVIEFNQEWTIVINPTDDYDAVRVAIDTLEPGGSTNFWDPIKDAITYFLTNDTSVNQSIVLLSDGEPTIGFDDGQVSYTPYEWAIIQANDARARDISMYTIAYDQDPEGFETMSRMSSSTLLNRAWETPAEQRTTNRGRNYAARATDASKRGSRYSMTDSNSAFNYWQTDLWSSIEIDEVRLWNRVNWNYSNETHDFWVLIWDQPFETDRDYSIAELIARTDVDAYFHDGVAQRPSTMELGAIWRYVRIQYAPDTYVLGTDNLAFSEVEVIWCQTWSAECTDVYNYDDFDGTAVDTLYGHIFGAIHCDCRPELVCGICGDGVRESNIWELCDEWSYCDDRDPYADSGNWSGTDCTGDPTICDTSWLGECRVRRSTSCTETCKVPWCADGIKNLWTDGVANTWDTDEEACDDGNDIDGDGCNTSCEIEACGDGVLDPDGPDNIWWNSDDEYCDGAPWCTIECRYLTCGDGLVTPAGSDGVMGTADDEYCDEWRYCNDGRECSDTPWICPGECLSRFVNWCSPRCNYGECGDRFVDPDGPDNDIVTTLGNEQCDLWKYCETWAYEGIECTHNPDICGIGNACTIEDNPACSSTCQLPFCGDGFETNLPSSETIYDCTGRGNICGDRLIDPDGPDDVVWNWDDEDCDDGMHCSDGTTSCTVDSVCAGIWDELCKPRSGDGCSLICTFEWYLWEAPSSCTNGAQDGNEVGIDCGGSCEACGTCIDSIQNSWETGVDCGGPCAPCASCSDGIQNGDEIWIDCGWLACGVCI